MTERKEIGRLNDGFVTTNHIMQVVFAANACRRRVTVEWDAVKNQCVFYANVPLPKKLAATIKKVSK